MSFVSIVLRFAINKMRRAVLQYIGSAVAFRGQSSSRSVCDKRKLQTCRPQTCRPADLQTSSELTGRGGVIDQYLGIVQEKSLTRNTFWQKSRDAKNGQQLE